MVGEAIGKMVDGLFKALVCAVLIAVIGIGYMCYQAGDYFINGNTIESKTKLEPELKFKTDGNKVDTIFIYREK